MSVSKFPHVACGKRTWGEILLVGVIIVLCGDIHCFAFCDITLIYVCCELQSLDAELYVLICAAIGFVKNDIAE